MLNTLRKIVQEVNGANDMATALDLIVKRVKSAMQCEVCSIYLFDATTGMFELMATEGLNPDAVGKVRMSINEGLVGLVGSREEPLNLEDAANHPRYRYFSETGEERYASFLGAPIIHQRRLMGVLVVQQKNHRQFDEGEEAFLVTIGAQLSGVLAHAEATGNARRVTHHTDKLVESRFMGLAASPGIGIGTGVVILPPADLSVVPDRITDDVAAELKLFQRAVELVREDMQLLAHTLSTQLIAEERALFDVYLMMLDDGVLGQEVRHLIEQGQWAQGALRQVINAHIQRFELMDDEYLRERSADIRDIGRRLLAHLQPVAIAPREYPKDTILISDELSLAMLGMVPSHRLAGLVSVRGSGNSHVAILARAMGIPTVMGAQDLPYSKLDGLDLVVDGYQGELVLNPTKEVRRQYRSMVAEERELLKELDALHPLPCETLDGHRILLLANTGIEAEIQRALDRGAEGVGLYRSEIPFMNNQRFPSEREQMMVYRTHLEALSPKPVTIRTLDIGGDKHLPYFPINEMNPFLGWRGIRVTLDHPEIFLVQMRAMLKASEHLTNLRVMLPMISNIAEVESALHLIHRAWHEVCEEGFQIPLPPVGLMIEIPAAVYQIRELAAMVDFVSVGSNDLTQYLLAVDRNNPRVADLYDHLHPAVLRALNQAVTGCHEKGKPIGICGEMAGDPLCAVLLLAMGFDSLSMNATNMLRVKWLLRNITMVQAKQLLAEVLTMDCRHIIHSTLKLALQNYGLSQIRKST